MKWRLVQDDDGRWYVIPALALKEWYDWVDTAPDGYYGAPDWANKVSGPEMIMFEKWTEG
jgi:hypothetical protein